MQTNTKTVNKTWPLLQTTGDKDEPNIVFMSKWTLLIENVFSQIQYAFSQISQTLVQEKFEDTKEATRSRKSKEDTQYNDKKKKNKRTNKLHRKQNIEQHELNYKLGVDSCAFHYKLGVDSCAPERINIYYKSFMSLSDFTYTNCLRSLISQSYVSTTN